jgi:hypothetical protein
LNLARGFDAVADQGGAFARGDFHFHALIELGGVLGIDPATIRRWETDMGKPSRELAPLIEAWLQSIS